MGLYIGTTIKATKKKRALVMYTCPKCNMYNEFVHEIVGEGKTFTIVKPQGKRAEALGKKMCEVAEKDVMKKAALFESKLKNGDYSELHLEHCCTNCGQVQPWVGLAGETFSKYGTYALFAGPILIVLGIVALFIDVSLGALVMAAGSILGLAVDAWLMKCKKMRIKKAYANLPESAKPRIRKYL